MRAASGVSFRGDRARRTGQAVINSLPESKPFSIAGILGVLGLLTAGGAAIYAVVQTGTFGGVPQCDSSFTTDLAKGAFDGSLASRVLGLSILELENVQETSATDTERQCKATALLNNTTEHLAIFDIKKHGDEWIVTIRLPDLAG